MIKPPHKVHVEFVYLHRTVACRKNTLRSIFSKSIVIFFVPRDPPLIPVSNSDSALKLRGRDEHTSYSSSQARIRRDRCRYLGLDVQEHRQLVQIHDLHRTLFRLTNHDVDVGELQDHGVRARLEFQFVRTIEFLGVSAHILQAKHRTMQISKPTRLVRICFDF